MQSLSIQGVIFEDILYTKVKLYTEDDFELSH